MNNNLINNVQCFSKGCYAGLKRKEVCFENIITSETLYSKGLSSDWHYHENIHFSHILNGGSLEQRTGWQHQQTPGNFLFYCPDIIHKNTGYQDSTRIFNIEIEEGFFLKYGVESEHPITISLYNQHLISIIILKILKEYYIADNCSSLSVSQMCLELTQRSLIFHRLKYIPQWTKKITELLHDRWNSNLTLEELSFFLQLHPVTISRYFSKYFKCTLGEYIRRIKIEKSLSLIRTNKYSLTKIAYECGFSDQSHFTKTFKQLTGLLPKEYKRL